MANEISVVGVDELRSTGGVQSSLQPAGTAYFADLPSLRVSGSGLFVWMDAKLTAEFPVFLHLIDNLVSGVKWVQHSWRDSHTLQ